MEKKANIGFLINNLGIGGAERVFVSDANSLLDEGCNVYMFILYGNKDKSLLINELLIPENNIIFLKASSIFDVSSYLYLYSFLKKNKINILYSTLHDAIFVSRVVSLFRFKVRLFTREANTTENKSFLHKISDALMNFRVNKMLAVSEEVKKSMLSYQPWYKSKIEVLYNGVVVPDGEVSKNKNKVVLTIGSLTPKKAHNVLIEAFCEVSKVFPDFSLSIIGSGVLESTLKEMVKVKGLENKVNFLGNKTYNEVCDYYKNSAIFVLPSNQEGCPNVLLEAMSYGLPSIATKVGAVPEIIEDGVSGFIVPKQNPELLTEAILKLLNSADLRLSLGNMARERIKSGFSESSHLFNLKTILF